jgi:hypothetical protein
MQRRFATAKTPEEYDPKEAQKRVEHAAKGKASLAEQS